MDSGKCLNKEYFRTSSGVLYCGDCLDVLDRISDDGIHLVVTSPPYYAYKDYGKDECNFENAPTYENYLDMMNKVFRVLYLKVVEDGRVCIVVDDKHTNLKTEGKNINRATHARFILMMENAGFEYKDLVIWAKGRVGHASGGAKYMLGSFPYPPNIPFVNWFEYILIFRKPGKSRVRLLDDNIKESSKLDMDAFRWASTSIWTDIPAERKRFKCPCPFPEQIPYRLIKLFSFVGETVLDPFAGSGTTLYVAEQLKRKWIGVEINRYFCEDIAKRLTRIENVLF